MKKYPIAEIFNSPQGEGLYAGTMMTFIRTAGCSVGKKLSPEDQDKFLMAEDPESQRAGEPILRNLPVYREKCTLYDGREFLCDTNFQTKEALTAEEIVARVPEGVDHVCITGGEPLNHDLTSLVNALYYKMKDIHIETSGTVLVESSLSEFEYTQQIDHGAAGYIWLTVSPKKNVLDHMLLIANELKFLVDENFDAEKIPEAAKQHALIYIQPVNFEHKINTANMKRCLELQKQFPHWRISNQSHKEWGVR